MGTVLGARCVWPDGTETSLNDAQAAIHGSNDGLVELLYAYGPHLIPTSENTDGMWRWRQLLPLDDGPILYPLAVGGTPLLAAPRLRELSGVSRLWLKDETRSPSGSNKDRATALVLEWCMRRGIHTVTAASTGNVASSLAVGAAAAGARAVIFVPSSVDPVKLRLMLLAGATVFTVNDGYQAAVRLSHQAARAFNWGDRNTGTNPLTLEAKKTVAFEIWEQLHGNLPDAVVVPVGDGTTLSAMHKGFVELVACGVADHVPRLVGVQAEGCQPLKRAWERNPERSGCATIADGIAVTAPSNAATAVRDVRMSRGGFVAVTDEAMVQAIGTLATAAGIVAEPAAAAAYAGVNQALQVGLVSRDDQVVLLITGSGLKTPRYLEPRGEAHAVQGSLDEVEKALR